MDYLNPCNKNQTAKILERFFYVSNGREYISVIPDEAERITKLPTLDEVKEDTNRVVTYAKEIILNADKYKDIIKPNGKKKKVDISYNMNKIMEMVGAKSYAGSFTRFMDGGIQIKTDENKISINFDIEEEDNTEVLFTVQDIYNPMIYLQAYNEDKELSECVVCGKHFIKDRNKKTCSGECHSKLHDLQVGKNNRKNKSATIADKKAI